MDQAQSRRISLGYYGIHLDSCLLTRSMQLVIASENIMTYGYRAMERARRRKEDHDERQQEHNWSVMPGYRGVNGVYRASSQATAVT